MNKIFTILFLFLSISVSVKASVFLPRSAVQVDHTSRVLQQPSLSSSILSRKQQRELRLNLYRAKRSGSMAAMAIPGYGVAEQVFVGGFANFLSIYNLIITARILLSWFPQAQGISLLQPIYSITDPYLNLFRGIIPPIFGLDLSPILAFFLLNVMSNVTAAVGAEIPADYAAAQWKNKPKQFFGMTLQRSRPMMPTTRKTLSRSDQMPSLNL